MSGGEDVVDLAFALTGARVPEDYADALWRAVRGVLPWLEEDTAAGVHPLARMSPGQGGYFLSRHSRLTLRLAAGRADDARALCGATLDLGGPLSVGAARVRALAPAKVLYSSFVAVEAEDEAAFLGACRREIEALGVAAQFIAGRAQAMQVDGRGVMGFSLMLHGLDKEDSLRVQRAGIGAERKRGCGIFVEHKSVAPVGG
jgi:CRISPR-associated protein Cas6